VYNAKKRLVKWEFQGKRGYVAGTGPDDRAQFLGKIFKSYLNLGFTFRQ